MRQLNNMPSSVISSHSMHIGVLATASHAIATGTHFSVYYKPRFFYCTILGQTNKNIFILCCYLDALFDSSFKTIRNAKFSFVNTFRFIA